MEKQKKNGKTLQLIALVLAIISISLCFIVWIIPFIGPIFVIGLAIAAIIIAIIALVRVNSYNNKNSNDVNFVHQSNARAIISAIVAVVGLILASLIFVMHVFVVSFIVTNLDNVVHLAMEVVYQDSIEAEYGVAYEVEDNVMLTINDAKYVDDTLTVTYSITNDDDEHELLFLNSFYYTTTADPGDKVYPYQNPVFIEPNVKATSQTLQITMPTKPATVGYDSINGQSIVIDVK